MVFISNMQKIFPGDERSKEKHAKCEWGNPNMQMVNELRAECKESKKVKLDAVGEIKFLIQGSRASVSE